MSSSKGQASKFCITSKHDFMSQAVISAKSSFRSANFKTKKGCNIAVKTRKAVQFLKSALVRKHWECDS